MKERIKWIDIAKFFGIFAIYLGHFGNAAGKGYPFVFTFHVPLFFLISGCLENLSKEKHIRDYIVKKIKVLLIPFFVFVILSIVLNVLTNDNLGLHDILDFLQTGIIKGAIRNQFFAGSLWFLTCLFIMELIFKLLSSFLNKYFILLLGFVSFCFVSLKLSPPEWNYNVDSALKYFIFFSTGYVIFPFVCRLFTLNSFIKKLIFGLSGVFSFVYSALLFFQHDLLSFLNKFLIGSVFIAYFRAIIVIWLIFVIARLLENAKPLGHIGENTLYLCGSEYIIKTLFSNIVVILGLNINLNNLLQVCLYTLLLLYVATRYLAPYEKRVLTLIQSWLD